MNIQFSRLGIKSYLFVISLLLPVFLMAQNKRYIKSHEYMVWLESTDANVVTERANLEQAVQSTFKTVKVPPNPVIPIIFHILYNDAAEQLSEATIYEQIDALNRDFGIGSNDFSHEAIEAEGFSSVSNQMGISFCLPEFSGDSSAINYYPVTKAAWQFDNAMKDPSTEGVEPWNPNQFLNVYVVDLHDTLAVAGYAQMPGGAAATDGIVIDYRFVGNGASPYNLGRTLVHLLGNYMGVYSIWGVDGCSGTKGDYASDTPKHNAPNFGCPSYQHISTCYQDKLVVEQSMNFMDSSDDACLSIWTTAQKYRFFAYLETARSGLLQHNFTCRTSPELAANELRSNGNTNQNTSLILSGGVKVYPNPGRDYIQIQLDLEKTNSSVGSSQTTFVDIRLTDLNGRLIFERKNVASSSTIRLATSEWLTGIYLLNVRQDGKVLHSEKVAIQH